VDLKDYKQIVDGSFGCLSKYYSKVLGKPASEMEAQDWAYLTGHLVELLNQALREKPAVKQYRLTHPSGDWVGIVTTHLSQEALCNATGCYANEV
jgi:hypothetical protein